jgi:hypothetical protein
MTTPTIASGTGAGAGEWVTPELREAERRILVAMYEEVDPDFGFFPFKAIANRSGVELGLVKPLVRLLAVTGEATFMRGLMTEDGEMVGSGYGLTEKGRKRAHSICVSELAEGRNP